MVVAARRGGAARAGLDPARLLIYFFGSVLLPATVHALADPLTRRRHLPRALAISLVLAAIPIVLGGIVWWLGDPIAQQLQSLGTELPRAWQTAQQWLGQYAFGQRLLRGMHHLGLGAVPWSSLLGIANITVQVVMAAFLMLVMGIYLTYSVDLYKTGFVRLVPVRYRGVVSEALDASGAALKSWLLGQGITMIAIGSMVGLGLWLLGAPLPFGIGLISGLFEFIPYIGPIASGGDAG